MIFLHRARGAALPHQEEGVARGREAGRVARRRRSRRRDRLLANCGQPSCLGSIAAIPARCEAGHDQGRARHHRRLRHLRSAGARKGAREARSRARGASRRRRCASARSRACRSCSCRATTRATGCRRPTSTTAPTSTCSSAPASPTSSRSRPAARSRRNLPPGTFVLIDQFVDRTHKRESSFFGKGCVAHVSMAHPVSPRLRIHLADAAEAEGIASCAAAPMCAWRARNSRRLPKASPTRTSAIR